jgi:hypothetical protein
MDLPTDAIKAAIKSGKPHIGIWSSLCSDISAEVPTRSPRSSAQPEKQAADHPETTAIATAAML